MKYISLVFLLAISHLPASSADCISSTNGFRCSDVDNDVVVGSNQSVILIDSGELDVDQGFLDHYPNATFLDLNNLVLRFPVIKDSNGSTHHLKSLWIVSSVVVNFRGILDNVHELEELKVSQTLIDYNILDKAFFKSNKQIKVLKLIDLELRSIESKAFDNLPELNYVELSGTHLQTLPVNVFAFNKKLTYLILSKNMFTSIPKVLWPKGLQVLKLDENQITSISEEDLLNLESITDLVLNKNDIQHIDYNSFDKLWDVKFITLASNNLDGIKKRHFQNLDKLEVIDLSFNNVDIKKLVDAGIPVIGTEPVPIETLYYDSSKEEELADMYYTAVYGSDHGRGDSNADADENYDYDYLDSQTNKPIKPIEETVKPPKCSHRGAKIESDDEDSEGSGLGNSEDGSGDCDEMDDSSNAISGCEPKGLKISSIGFLLVLIAICDLH